MLMKLKRKLFLAAGVGLLTALIVPYSVAAEEVPILIAQNTDSLSDSRLSGSTSPTFDPSTLYNTLKSLSQTSGFGSSNSGIDPLNSTNGQLTPNSGSGSWGQNGFNSAPSFGSLGSGNSALNPSGLLNPGSAEGSLSPAGNGLFGGNTLNTGLGPPSGLQPSFSLDSNQNSTSLGSNLAPGFGLHSGTSDGSAIESTLGSSNGSMPASHSNAANPFGSSLGSLYPSSTSASGRASGIEGDLGGGSGLPNVGSAFKNRSLKVGRDGAGDLEVPPPPSLQPQSGLHSEPVRPDSPLRRALTFLHQRHYEESLAELSKVLANSPNNAQAHYLKAVILVELRRYAAAQEEYKQTIKSDPDSGVAKLAEAGLLKLAK